MHVIFIAAAADYMDHEKMMGIFNVIRFETLLRYGTIPDNSCVWMSWKGWEEGDCSTVIYERLDKEYALRKRKVNLVRSLFLPDPLIWDDRYDMLLILGNSYDLRTYVTGLRKFAPPVKKKTSLRFPDYYVYKMETRVIDTTDEYGNASRELKVLDIGFISDRSA